MTHLLQSYGLVILFFLVAIEGAGIPLPGETTLIAAAVLASNGHFHSIEVVIVIAAAGAIAGDNTGYWIGRLGGRKLLDRIPVLRSTSTKLLPRAERFFKRHGAKTVLVARFVAVLRTTAAWMAGISHMRWRVFFLFDAAGGILWATAIGLIAYVFGKAVADTIGHYGLYAVIGIVILAAIGFVGYRVWHRRVERAISG
jgi:membrane protein DedA with SNARE-associated domain